MLDVQLTLKSAKKGSQHHNNFYVDVVNFKNPYDVISELIYFVKTLNFIHKVNVKFRGSSEVQFRLSNHKRVCFSSNGKNIKKDIATNLIKDFIKI